jgi:hypothetical protein
MSTITVRIQNNYGSQQIYPACTQSALFTDLVGQRTLTHSQIQIIKQLGFKIEVKPSEPVAL